MSEPLHPNKSPVARLIEILCGDPLGLDDVQLAEVLWLAQRLPPLPPAGVPTLEPVPEETPVATRPPEPVPGFPTSAPAGEEGSPDPEAVLLTGHPGSGVATGRGQTAPFRAPTPKALQQPLELGRALRALRRQVKVLGREEVDEEATAERIADEGLWLPWMRPVRARWLTLELIVDASRSMALWRQTIRELRTLLHHHGAFRDVRTWSLVTDAPDGRVRLYRGPAGRGTERDRRELLDAAGRRLIVVASDCISAGWHSGQVGELLRYWGARAPVAILQVLPERLWGRTALRRLSTAWLHGTTAAAPDVKLVSGPAPGLAGPREPGEVPIPVVTLEKESLESWGRVVAGAAEAWTPGVLLAEEGEWGAPRSPAAMTAVERVRRFEAMTSPLARQLVRLFAAAPLSLPVMRLIWQTMLPEARHGHFAEVMLSGLIRQATPERAGELEEATLDFVEGVREVLLESVPSSQTWEILRATSRYTQRNIGKTLDFPALLANPEMLGEEVDERLQPFAQVAASVLRQLGGYDELVARLEGAPSQRTRIAGITPHVTSAEEAPEENKQPIPVASIPTATWRWSGKWVAVVGYHREAIDLGPFRSSEDYQQLLKLGHRLGQMLAREGHGLVSKERSSVDVAVEQAFAQEFRRLGGDPSAVLQQLIKGHPLFMRRGTREIKQLPFEADAVVLLGGPLGRDIDVWSLYTGAGVMNFSLREPWAAAADAHVSNNWKGVLESLDVSLEVDASITDVTFVRLRDLIKQAPNRIAPYAKALLLLIASEEVELADSNPWQTDLLWELVREAGLPLPVDDGGTGFFKTLLEAELEPELPLLQHELRLRANQVAHLRLLGCLPAMRDRLSEDVSRMGDLGELGRRLQARLRVLLFESGGGAEVEEAGNGKVPPKQSRVTEKRSEQLVKALLSAFPIGTELAKFVGFRLRRGPSFSAGEPLQRQVRHLVEQAEQEGWIEELVDAARRARPGNPLLKAIRTLRAVILTVLAAESQAVRAHLTELREGAHPEGTIYERGHFFSQEQTWDVIIAEVMPHDDLEVERILQFFEPTVVLSIGIAAGIRDVAIGDVVVANRVYSFDSGKVENTLGTLPDAHVAASSFDLVQRALDEALREDWLARIGESSETGPRVFVAPIVTAMSVLTASNLDAIDVLKERYHDVLALDVEGFGMWNAVQSYPSVSVLVIRGISDLMDRDKDDGVQQEAARNAAAFAFELLAKY